MSLLLPTRQAEELYVHSPPLMLIIEANMLSRYKSIIAYLSANSLPNAATALRTELNLGEDVFDGVTTKKYETLLEKKWNSIVRLQKKVLIVNSLPSVPESC